MPRSFLITNKRYKALGPDDSINTPAVELEAKLEEIDSDASGKGKQLYLCIF